MDTQTVDTRPCAGGVFRPPTTPPLGDHVALLVPVVSDPSRYHWYTTPTSLEHLHEDVLARVMLAAPAIPTAVPA